MLRGELKWGAFRCAELFCLPSHQENFGIVVAEALACGLPVAIAEPVNISAEVAAAGAGLVHGDTAESTRRALSDWLAMSRADRLMMGQHAKSLFHRNFDFAVNANSLHLMIKQQIAFSAHSQDRPA
jgi:glycosyltransferase involved in cell wall biosynthesis